MLHVPLARQNLQDFESTCSLSYTQSSLDNLGIVFNNLSTTNSGIFQCSNTNYKLPTIPIIRLINKNVYHYPVLYKTTSGKYQNKNPRSHLSLLVAYIHHCWCFLTLPGVTPTLIVLFWMILKQQRPHFGWNVHILIVGHYLSAAALSYPSIHYFSSCL